MTDFQREKQLESVLLKLAKGAMKDENSTYYSAEFEKIFFISENEFYRLPYSSVYKIISLIDNNDIENCSNDDLSINIERLIYLYKPIRHNVQKSIKKLADHINLDVARLNYTKTLIRFGDDFTKAKTKSLDEKLKDLSNKQTMLQNKQKRTESDYKNIQNQYIAILGIFASVILAFVGGMTFSTSVLNNIGNASIYKLIAVAIIIGWVFFLLVWTLLFYITTLTKTKSDKKFFMSLFVFVNLLFIFGSTFLIILKFVEK